MYLYWLGLIVTEHLNQSASVNILLEKTTGHLT
jgi:hypothetical protein